jgi:hypothetical protein
MKAPVIQQTYDPKEMQKILDDLYQYVGELQAKVPGDILAKGTPSGRTYTLYVDDTTITSTTVKAR